MSDSIILDFPVLVEDDGDFVEGVSYEVEAKARQIDRKLEIRHTLRGQSFISKLVKSGDAKFSVLLLYRDSAERQHHLHDTDISINDHEIIATQTIPIKFSYAPEITPSIVILEAKKLTVDASSGLTDFWEQGEYFDIPQYSRVALGLKLKFTAGDLSKLMKVISDEKLGDGEMKVEVNENVGEGETPVSLYCGQGVYDELNKITPAEPSNSVESMRSAIITQALCAIYAYMQNLNNDHEASGVLAAHLDMLEEKTNLNWRDDNFSPSLAATRMQPYAIKALSDEADYD